MDNGHSTKDIKNIKKELALLKIAREKIKKNEEISPDLKLLIDKWKNHRVQQIEVPNANERSNAKGTRDNSQVCQTEDYLVLKKLKKAAKKLQEKEDLLNYNIPSKKVQKYADKREKSGKENKTEEYNNIKKKYDELCSYVLRVETENKRLKSQYDSDSAIVPFRQKIRILEKKITDQESLLHEYDNKFQNRYRTDNQERTDYRDYKEFEQELLHELASTKKLYETAIGGYKREIYTLKEECHRLKENQQEETQSSSLDKISMRSRTNETRTSTKEIQHPSDPKPPQHLIISRTKETQLPGDTNKEALHPSGPTIEETPLSGPSEAQHFIISHESLPKSRKEIHPSDELNCLQSTDYRSSQRREEQYTPFLEDFSALAVDKIEDYFSHIGGDRRTCQYVKEIVASVVNHCEEEFVNRLTAEILQQEEKYAILEKELLNLKESDNGNKEHSQCLEKSIDCKSETSVDCSPNTLFKNHIAYLEERLAVSAANMELKEKELENAKENLDIKIGENSELRMRLETHKTDPSELNELKSENKRLKSQIDRVMGEKYEFEKSCKNESSSLKEECDQLRVKNSHLQKQIDSLVEAYRAKFCSNNLFSGGTQTRID